MIGYFIKNLLNIWCLFDKITTYNYVIRNKYIFCTPETLHFISETLVNTTLRLYLFIKLLYKLVSRAPSKVFATVYLR
jgi:hypothetical protein